MSSYNTKSYGGPFFSWFSLFKSWGLSQKKLQKMFIVYYSIYAFSFQYLILSFVFRIVSTHYNFLNDEAALMMLIPEVILLLLLMIFRTVLHGMESIALELKALLGKKL